MQSQIGSVCDVLQALRAWGETWFKSPRESRAINYTHRTCGKPTGLGASCEGCGQPLRREDIIAELSPDYQDEREARWEAFKARRQIVRGLRRGSRPCNGSR